MFGALVVYVRRKSIIILLLFSALVAATPPPAEKPVDKFQLSSKTNISGVFPGRRAANTECGVRMRF